MNRTGPEVQARERSSARREAVELKTTPPSPPRHHVARPRVTACFAPSTAARLTLVTGPPGAGKTTAVREWIASRAAREAWLTVDTDDNVPSAFWSDVLASLRHGAPEISAHDDLPGAEHTRPHGTPTQVLAELAALRDDLVLVLDEFQVVHARAVLAELQTFLERKPASLHVVVVSRSDPSLPLARWRVREELVDVREADLRFRPDEAQAYFAMFADLRLDEHAVTTLTRRTEGWIAGLQLAVISLRSNDDRDGFIDSFGGTDRFIADFLLDEVLASQPDDVREFLLETSVLPRLDAGLCEAATGRHDAETQLRRLEAANLFLVRADAAATSFRYHALFRDLLRFELERREPERARVVREHAARHLERTGDVVAAVGLFVAAGNDAAAFALGIPRTFELSPRARIETSACLDLLSPAYVGRDPERALTFADALRRVGRADEALIWLERACATTGTRAAEDENRARAEAIWTGWYADEGDAHAAVRHGEAVPAAVGRPERSADPLLYGLGPALARSWLLLANPERARRSLVGLAGSADPLTNEVVVPALLARVEAHEGRLRDAEVNAERALRVATALDAEGCAATIDARLARASVRRERDDLAGAVNDVDDAIALAVELPSRPYLLLARIEEARNVEAERGPFDARERLWSACASYGRPLPLSLADTAGRLDAKLSVRCDDLERAARIAATLPVGLERELLLVATDVRDGEVAQARERLASLQPVHLVHRIGMELLRGMAAEGLLDLRRHVAHAAELAAPEGFRRIFIENGPAVSRALRSLATSSELDPMAVDLVGAVVDLPAVQSGTPMVEPLSEREASVLRYFPTALNYHDIASELLISVNTLKTHIKSIHRKLGVTSRTEAIREAQQLGMLSGTHRARSVAG